jgi:hypothetical protein
LLALRCAAQALVLAKVELAQSQYELENMKYLMKSGERDPSRGISAMWGSIGARGRSLLFEAEELEDADAGAGAEAGGGQGIDAIPEEDPFPAEVVVEPPRRWSLWSKKKPVAGAAPAAGTDESSASLRESAPAPAAGAGAGAGEADPDAAATDTDAAAADTDGGDGAEAEAAAPPVLPAEPAATKPPPAAKGRWGWG